MSSSSSFSATFNSLAGYSNSASLLPLPSEPALERRAPSGPVSSVSSIAGGLFGGAEASRESISPSLATVRLGASLFEGDPSSSGRKRTLSSLSNSSGFSLGAEPSARLSSSSTAAAAGAGAPRRRGLERSLTLFGGGREEEGLASELLKSSGGGAPVEPQFLRSGSTRAAVAPQLLRMSSAAMALAPELLKSSGGEKALLAHSLSSSAGASIAEECSSLQKRARREASPSELGLGEEICSRAAEGVLFGAALALESHSRRAPGVLGVAQVDEGFLWGGGSSLRRDPRDLFGAAMSPAMRRDLRNIYEGGGGRRPPLSPESSADEGGLWLSRAPVGGSAAAARAAAEETPKNRLIRTCAAIHESFRLTHEGQEYALRTLGNGQHSIIYRLDERRVVRVLQDATPMNRASAYTGPCISILECTRDSMEALVAAGLPVARIENNLVADGYAVQEYIQGAQLASLPNLEGHNQAIADVIKRFIEFSLREEEVVDLQLSNFRMHPETGLPVLVDFYEHGNEDVLIDMQAFLQRFLPQFCGAAEVGRYLTENIAALAPSVYAYLRANGCEEYLPA